MRHLIILAVVVLTTIFSGCTTKIVPEGPWIKKIDSEEASRLVINFSGEMKRVHQLTLEDSWIAYDDDIKKVCLRYSSQRLLDIKEARLLIVEVVEEFLTRLNNHSTLSFELETYPFTARQLDIQINFESFYGLYLDPLYIGMTWLQANCVHFYAFDRKNPNVDWDHHRFEPYSKSRELALIQKEADIPYYEKENPPKKVSSYSYDRYTPYRPYPPYSSNVNYPPNAPYYPNYPQNNSYQPAVMFPSASSSSSPAMVPEGQMAPNVEVINPQVSRMAYPMTNVPEQIIVPGPYNSNVLNSSYGISNTEPASSLPLYNPNVPANSVGAFNPNFYSDLAPYNPNVPAVAVPIPGTSSDLPPYNPNVPANSTGLYNPSFYSDLPPYNPNVPAN